jgi:hypothetical protein
MDYRYPLTIEQVRQTLRDVAAIAEQAEEIARLMSACYGDSDQRTIRAQECSAAIQRLQVEMGREHASIARG